ncbi:NAD(P)H-hydrate dehydratase [Fodinicola acaciae]|uniref:NAD(P)H-hydrate dehydratase n=1 Tax=Fodinicola acaciae TaxID=2681555 RepID=UPI0013D28FD6|nr:NAD(P)H-hydrate dehydratase [Fodinicola acaciae]
MRYAYAVDQVRAAESALMAKLPDGALMQRAAAGLARRVAVLLKDGRGAVYGARVALMVGAGDNGGDALYAGARLARRGAKVEAVLVNPERAHAGGLAALKQAGGRVATVIPAGADLVVDGIVGIGAKGGLRPDAAELAAAAALTGAPIVAVDTPSGIDPTIGAVHGEAVRADVTVTFGCLKAGLMVGPGATRSGIVELVDLGIGPYLGAPAALIPDDADIAGWWPQPNPTDDKYTRGVIGVAAGSDTYPGAAVLAVGAALAGPTGMVRYAGSALEPVRAAYPEVVATATLRDAGRVQAWAVGSGLGTGEDAAAVLRQVLQSDLPVLIDADGLTVLAEHQDWVRTRKAPTLLTPHDREFARIFGPVGDDRLAAARRAAAALHCTVLLKGDRTIVADRDGTAYVNPTGTAALATAGSGDVLSGIAGALLAAGLPAAKAGVAGAYVHGLAGRLAAENGPVSAGSVRDAMRAAAGRLRP